VSEARLTFRVDIHVGLWRKSKEGEDLLVGADWVIDAIDNIETKADLLTHCYKQSIPVFSSMGSGAKMDPTRVQIALVPLALALESH
jgi:tRNA A37 threonylcarbamoyladenosine dehydratase